MIYKLVCAGTNTFNLTYKKDETEVIIAVDGGINILLQNNIKVDYYFGDNDSTKSKIEAKNINIYNPVKDESDFDLALSFLIKDKKIDINTRIEVYNATGGRLDHYYAILNSILKYKAYNIKIIDDLNEIFVSSKKMVFKNNNFKYISFFSLEDNTKISLEGFKYNLKDYLLNKDDNLCLSNEIESTALLTTNKEVLVIRSNSLK